MYKISIHFVLYFQSVFFLYFQSVLYTIPYKYIHHIIYTPIIEYINILDDWMFYLVMCFSLYFHCISLYFFFFSLFFRFVFSLYFHGFFPIRGVNTHDFYNKKIVEWIYYNIFAGYCLAEMNLLTLVNLRAEFLSR